RMARRGLSAVRRHRFSRICPFSPAGPTYPCCRRGHYPPPQHRPRACGRRAIPGRIVPRITSAPLIRAGFRVQTRPLLLRTVLLTLYSLARPLALKRLTNGQSDRNYKGLLGVRCRYVTKEQSREADPLVVDDLRGTRPAHLGEGTTACASDSKKFGAW